MINIIEEKLASYDADNTLEEEHAIKEILQEIALYGLWRSGFFERAAFQGDTSLRILYGMTRYSEDLDFVLKEADSRFNWQPFLDGMSECFEDFGLRPEMVDRSRMDRRIKQALIKENSMGRQLNLSFYRDSPSRKQKIKLEIDVDPPNHSGFAYRYLDFPLDFEVCHQDLSSNFALKIHALLCRNYVKGRDWYDFNWYVKSGAFPNIAHLQSALYQWGPWQKQQLEIDRRWLQTALINKISTIDWRQAASDVERFLPQQEQHSLQLWSERFFISKVEQVLTDRD